MGWSEACGRSATAGAGSIEDCREYGDVGEDRKSLGHRSTDGDTSDDACIVGDGRDACLV